jgi:hypothetical protein
MVAGMSDLPQIVLKKSFWGDDQNFSGPLMPFARGDMRDHIASRKNDHGAPYGRYAVLRRWSQLKMSFCEIFSVVQFSTFATLSPNEQTSVAGPLRRQRSAQTNLA